MPVTTTPKKKKTAKKSNKTSSTSSQNKRRGGSPASASPSAKSSKKKKSKAPVQKEAPREVVHPDVAVQIFGGKKPPMTREQNRKLLGWQVPPDGAKEGIERVGTEKVWLTKNRDNRPFNLAWIEMLKQEILTRKWRLNCDPIKVGESDNLIDGQHRCIAFELACQEYEKHPGKWKDYWQQEPTLDTLVVFGVLEDDETVNTIDFVRPRSLADVIYRSECFRDMKRKDRMKCARMTGDAVKFLWLRTGASHLAFSPRRTHSESMDFIERHPKILSAVKHIFEENGKDKIQKFINCGYAAGLMYLFGASSTERESDDGRGYSQLDVPTETAINFEQWDKAEEFFVMLAQRDKSVHALIELLGREYEEDEESWVMAERIGLAIKSWLQFADGKPITAKSIELAYETDGDGFEYLAESPTCGGIDLSPDN